jgi:hypothetical protein
MNVNYVKTQEKRVSASDYGGLRINVIDGATMRPVENAVVDISYTGEPDSLITEVRTDGDGATPMLQLAAPPLEYSMEPSENQPYSQYTVKIAAPGYEDYTLGGAEVFSGIDSYCNASIRTAQPNQAPDVVLIGANTLYGDYPEKIPESEIQPVNNQGEVVLSRVVIPETIVVHDGAPTDSTAKDYYVGYADYIKNVASSEIYSTWPEETLKANILAIMSFTLNRVYTEFYRNKGYNFTITSSTAYDHKWIYGRNIFDNISNVVDDLFNLYLSRPNVKQPILTQYCDGKKVSCPKWMSQWGSKYLGDQNYSAIEILRYYYGDSMYINTAEQIEGIPSSWGGTDLDIGSSGQKVRQIQEQLNLIGEFYNSIPALAVDGIYGEKTAQAVSAFQKAFDMPVSGIVDFPTWYRISAKYVALSGIAELQ